MTAIPHIVNMLALAAQAQAPESGEAAAASGLDFAIWAYVIGLTLLLGYAAYLWVVRRSLVREAARRAGDA